MLHRTPYLAGEPHSAPSSAKNTVTSRGKGSQKNLQNHSSIHDRGAAQGLILQLTRSMGSFAIEFNPGRNDIKIFPVQMSAINLDDGYLIPWKVSGIKLKRQRYIHISLNWETPQLTDNLN